MKNQLINNFHEQKETSWLAHFSKILTTRCCFLEKRRTLICPIQTLLKKNEKHQKWKKKLKPSQFCKTLDRNLKRKFLKRFLIKLELGLSNSLYRLFLALQLSSQFLVTQHMELWNNSLKLLVTQDFTNHKRTSQLSNQSTKPQRQSSKNSFKKSLENDQPVLIQQNQSLEVSV